jgi:pilus assembly protein TadC
MEAARQHALPGNRPHREKNLGCGAPQTYQSESSRGWADDSPSPWVEDPMETVAAVWQVNGMNILLLMVVLLLLFGGGGFYFGGPVIGGGGIGLILLICLIIFLVGGFRTRN